MLTHPVFRSGNIALITGGASGIGLALANKCASYGMKVIVADNNAINLKAAKETIKGPGEVTTVELDVGMVEQFEGLKERIEKEFGGKLDLLVLNAGIGLKGTWADSAYFQKILSVNLFGVINGLNTLLPFLTSSSAANPSSIVITGSKQGITNPPGNPAYNASKAAVKTLAEHLSYDLYSSSPHTSVHLLIPGWTFTGLSGNSPIGEKKEKPAGAWSAEQVVEYLEAKMGEGKFYVVCPDNDVSEETDKKRVLWAANDLVQGRPPLTRWREEYKAEAEEWMARQKI